MGIPMNLVVVIAQVICIFLSNTHEVTPKNLFYFLMPQFFIYETIAKFC
jgi:hypothetical protein